MTRKGLSVILISLALALSAIAEKNYFEEQGFIEMNKINMEPLYEENKYMLGYFSEDESCDEDCREALELIKQAREAVRDRIPEMTLVYINTKENKKLVRELRVVDIPSIGYLANRRVVLYNEDYDSESFAIWLRKRIILPSEGYSTSDNMDGMKNAWNLVVTYAGKRNRYYEMFRYVASSYSDLHFGHSFSAPVTQPSNPPLGFEVLQQDNQVCEAQGKNQFLDLGSFYC